MASKTTSKTEGKTESKKQPKGEDPMEAIFDRLRSLQEILSQKFEVEREIKELPRAVATKTELVNRLKKSFVEKNEQFRALQARIEDLRQKANDAEKERERSEQLMEHIKTQREYEALDKEIKDGSTKEQELRRELQRESQRLDEMKEGMDREELLIKKQEEEITAEKTRYDEQFKEKEKLLKGLEKQEKAITPDLDEELVFKFERIIKSKSGIGIVPIRDGVCDGCHIVLPAHFVNRVRNGTGILFCPDCSRILFYDETVPVEEEATMAGEMPEEVDEAFIEEDEDEGEDDDDDDDDDESEGRASERGDEEE
jgi:uncharacterized protein